MLVLRRKVGESIVLAGAIYVSVLAVEGERVKIGISAPPDITIVREELLRSAMPDPMSHQSTPPTPTPVSNQNAPTPAQSGSMSTQRRISPATHP
jgi:carbon storage regulator